MAEHLSSEQIEGYRRRDLAPAQVLALDNHLSACADCREKLRETQQADSTFRAMQSTLQATAQAPAEHLSFEALEAYVKNRAGELDREIVESHVELCPHCARELKDLQEFAVMMSEPPVEAAGKTEP